ncbi:MAG: hypothetical protein KatS3mg104_1788 [Phycisphaerae bacterium]|jgi:hypothetical protein|nr:MAG: hypothetical protein KatS3mg104_1788 [Phycisphaerae bacterium]
MTIQSRTRHGNDSVEPFAGFALPTSNTTWAMNQFFDVCLPHCSRGCVRVVGALLRWTIGWCDHEGKPQQERHTVSYAEFDRAGVGKDSIKAALAEAIERHLIRCVREPVVQRAGRPAVSGLYELAWDDGVEYVKDPARFRGFFAGEGHRTPIPDQFFDVVLPNETLAVIKVVGAVIRFSIGFTTKWGHRRQLASLSYEDIRRYTKLADRTSLSAAIETAIARNYIRRVEAGYFDPRGGRMSRSAVYALKWLNDAAEESNARKTRPEESTADQRSETPTGNARISRPAKHSGIPTGLQITVRKNMIKQQVGVEVTAARRSGGRTAVAVSSEEDRQAARQMLTDVGFDEWASEELAARYPVERIVRQIDWLALRRPSRNPLGLLRRAIEEDWQKPDAVRSWVDPTASPDRPEEHARVQQQVAALSNRFRV